MAGVITSTATRTGSAASAAPRSAQYLVVGMTERGPTDPTPVTSLAQFVDLFGDRVTYGFLTDDLTTYFRERGARAIVKRVVGAAATVGTLTLKDSGAANSVRLDATSPGAWSSSITVEVIAGAVAGTVTISLYRGGAILNRYSNLVDVPAIVAALATNTLVRAVALGANDPAPLAATALSAGSDDRATVDTARLLGSEGLGKLTKDLGVGAVAIPGYAADLVGAALIQHGRDTRRKPLLTVAPDATQASARQAAQGLLSSTGENAHVLWPYLQVTGPAGVPLAIAATGYVAAARARAHAEVGPWRVPAGEISTADYVLGPVGGVISEEDAKALDEAQVTVIRSVGGRTQLQGYRSLSTNQATYRLGNTADATNAALEDMEALLFGELWANVDAGGAYFQTVRAALIGYLDPIRAAGGLYALVDADGNAKDPGYQVLMDSSLNTVATLARNEVYAEVGLRWSPVAEFIYLKVTTVGIDVAF
jgi:hypothetical protein